MAKEKVQLLAYIDARAVQARLDAVVGPFGWSTTFRAGPGGGIICRLELVMPETGEWVSKEDGAENTDIEAVKGGVSDAFKRAAVNWGVGRYLYSLDTPWVKVEPAGDIYVNYYDKKTKASLRGYCSKPRLPQWASPEAWPPLASAEVSDG
jgi:hypothetical protein